MRLLVDSTPGRGTVIASPSGRISLVDNTVRLERIVDSGTSTSRRRVVTSEEWSVALSSDPPRTSTHRSLPSASPPPAAFSARLHHDAQP